MSDAPAPVTQNGHVEDGGHKVFAGNLAYSTTDEGLKAFFAPVQAEIVSAQVILRGTRSAGYGFVGFASAEAAEKAAGLLNKKELDGREVIVEIAKAADQKDKERSEKKANKRAGRRGSKAPPGEVTEAEANGEGDKPAAAAAADGDATAAKPKKKKAPRKKKSKTAEGDEGAATTTENAVPPATETPAADGEKPAKKAKTPKPARKARPPRPAGQDPEGEPSKNMLFVANLGFSVDDSGLSELFTTAGIKVLSARVVRRRWGQPRKSKGYGFVDVGDEEEQKKAIAALQGKEVAGREIAVKIAVNAKDVDEAVEKAAGREATPETTVVAS